MQNAETKIKCILHRAPLLEEARASMRRLGLDQRSVGERPALDLLEEGMLLSGPGLAIDWDILVKELSRGKQKAMSGQQVGELFDKALVFANALLSGIDKTRLKAS